MGRLNVTLHDLWPHQKNQYTMQLVHMLALLSHLMLPCQDHILHNLTAPVQLQKHILPHVEAAMLS